MSEVKQHNKQQVPKIRFEGFSEYWKKMPFSKIYSHVRNGFVGTATPHYVEQGIPYIQGRNIKGGKLLDNGYVNISEEFHKSKPNSKVLVNDLLMVQSGHVGDTAVVSSALEGANCHAILIATPKNQLECNSYFYNSYFLSDFGKVKTQIITTGNTVKHILSSDLKTLIVPKPSYQEQTQIGNFFQQLDQLIELQTRAVESAEKYRKAMLQKMFPQKGEKVPQVRFAGFSGDWKKHTLSKIVDQVRSYSLSRSVETGVNTGFKYIHYGDIHLGKACYLDTDKGLSFINLDTDYVLLQRGDLVLADASEDYIGIAEPCVIDFEPQVKLVAGLHTIAIRPDQSQNPIFLYYYFKTKLFKKHCYRVGTGMKVFGITFNNLSKYEGYFPIIKEQIQIGNFFQKLDQNIETEKKKLEQYQDMKTAMLQRMFV